jgi:hypothetical protein
MPEPPSMSDVALNSDLPQKKRQALFQILAVVILLPFIEVFVARWWHDERTWIVINIVTIMFPMLRWCFLDASELGLRLSRFMQLFIIAFAALAIPVWLLRSRGIRGVLSIGWLLLFVVLLAGATWLAEEIAVELWSPHWVPD